MRPHRGEAALPIAVGAGLERGGEAARELLLGPLGPEPAGGAVGEAGRRRPGPRDLGIGARDERAQLGEEVASPAQEPRSGAHQRGAEARLDVRPGRAQAALRERSARTYSRASASTDGQRLKAAHRGNAASPPARPSRGGGRPARSTPPPARRSRRPGCPAAFRRGRRCGRLGRSPPRPDVRRPGPPPRLRPRPASLRSGPAPGAAPPGGASGCRRGRRPRGGSSSPVRSRHEQRGPRGGVEVRRLDVAEVLDVEGDEPQRRTSNPHGHHDRRELVALSRAGFTTPGERSSASSTTTSWPRHLRAPPWPRARP